MSTVRIDQIATVTAAVGDKYIIFDASTGDIGAVDVIADMQAASSGSAGVAGKVPAPSAGTTTRYLNSGATWTEAPVRSKGSNQIMEFAMIRNPNGNWNQNTFTIGGMTFQWSQAASNGGYLTMMKASGLTQSSQSGGQTCIKYSGSTVSGDTGGTASLWPATATGICTGQTMTSAYQLMEYNLVTRADTGSISCHWCIKVHSEGGTGLAISGTYIGPVIS